MELLEVPASAASKLTPILEVLKKKNPINAVRNNLPKTSTLTSSSNTINRPDQSYIDSSLSEEQLLAIIDQQASMGNKDPGKSPDEILGMIDENNAFFSNPSNENQDNIESFSTSPNLGSSSFADSATSNQNNFVPSFSHIPATYLPYFPMNFYHHQMLMDQAAQHAGYFNNNAASTSQIEYNQNLDNYIETVFQDPQEPNQSSSVFLNYNANSTPVESEQLNKVPISKENGVLSENPVLTGNSYKATTHLQKDAPPKYQSSQIGTVQHTLIPEIPHTNTNQYFNNNSQIINKPISVKSSNHHPYHNTFKPTGSIKKISAMPTFPPNTTLIPCQQPNVYLISNQDSAIPKADNNFQYMIPPPQISIRPPLRTKLSVINQEFMFPNESKETNDNSKNSTYTDCKDDNFSEIDFSSLDTSDIVISKIVMPDIPLHKKRKQKFIILEDCEVTFKLSEASKSTAEKTHAENSPPSGSPNISNSDPQNNSEKIIFSKKKLFKKEELSKKKNLRKLIRKQRDSGFDDTDDEDNDDSSREDSVSDKNSSKSLKCMICMKIFKSSQTFAKHKKQHPVDEVKLVSSEPLNEIENLNHTDLLKPKLNNYCENEIINLLESNENNIPEIFGISDVENSLAELFAEKKNDEENLIFNNLPTNKNNYDDNNIQPDDKVEASLAVLFSEGPSKREFEKSSFDKCNTIENNEIIKYNILPSPFNKNGDDKLSNKRKKNTVISVDQKLSSLRNDEGCEDLLETLKPKEKIKPVDKGPELITKQNSITDKMKSAKRNQLSHKILKVDLQKDFVTQNFKKENTKKDNTKKENIKKDNIKKETTKKESTKKELTSQSNENSSVQNDSPQILKNLNIFKQQNESIVLEENNQKRKTRSQTKRKNEIDLATKDKRKK